MLALRSHLSLHFLLLLLRFLFLCFCLGFDDGIRLQVPLHLRRAPVLGVQVLCVKLLAILHGRVAGTDGAIMSVEQP